MAMSDLRIVKYHGWQMLRSEVSGVGPYLCNQIQRLINAKMGCNIVIVGNPGVSKSYLAMDICRNVEGLTADGKDRFSLDQVVFTYADFMDLVLKLKPGKPIVFDEPSYSMGKREWYKDLNKVLVQTIESFRFKCHPLFLPIININLLDKTIRSYLIQYLVEVKSRGHAFVYHLAPSQFMDKVYHEFYCELVYRLKDGDVCNKPSCLECEKIMTCNVFRARYERKKASIQESRYLQAKDRSEKTESTAMTILELEAMALELKPMWFIDGKIDIQKLRVSLLDKKGANISQNKAYYLKAALEEHNHDLAPQ